MATPSRTRRTRRAFLATLLVGSLVASVGPAAVAARDPGRDVAASPAGKTLAGRLEARTGSRALAPAPGEIGVVSSNAFLYTDDTIAIVGDVLNLKTTRLANAELTVDFYNGTEHIGSIYGFPFLYEIGYGATSPFWIYDVAPPGTTAGGTTFEVTVTFDGTVITAPPGGAFLITPGPTTIEGDLRHFSGTIKNVGTHQVEGIFAAIATYDSNGDVIDSIYDLTTPDALGPGQTADYDLFLNYDAGTPISRSAVTADAYSSLDGLYYTAWSNYFDDVGASSFRPDIIWNAEQGITTGCGAGKFCPNANVPRDQMASFLSRALGLSGPAANAFTDDAGNPHEPNINLVAREGIASGCGVGLYCPAAQVARDQMASFLSRALDLSGPAANAFTDDNGNIHEPNINLVARDGIASGCGASIYCPSAKVTRAQMAAFLHRAFD